MNFIFISPNFPHTYWNFCDRLQKNGVNVLGIGDTPYEETPWQLRQSVTEYYVVNSLENYDEVFRAVAFFSFKYGKIDWIESNNEYWLRQDARLRDDFNIKTGYGYEELSRLQSKFYMKELYKKAGVPSARCSKFSSREEALAFIGEVSYPVIVKPEVGMGASKTYKIKDENQLDAFFAEKDENSYIIEEFIDGEIYSYDAVINSKSEPLFESMTSWPKVLDVVNECLDFSYYIAGEVEEQLKDYGRKTVKAFGVKSRFVHLEFFRLNADKKGLGKKGDFVALEANLRVAGGYTPDIMNYAHSTDVYRIWADMIATDRRLLQKAEEEYYGVYVARRDRYTYVHSEKEIEERYKKSIITKERAPEVLSDDMGNLFYIAKLKEKEDVEEFVSFVLEKGEER